MLGTFPKAFPKRQLSNGIFPSCNLPTVKFLKRQFPKSVLAAALGTHLAHPSRNARPHDIAHLGSCHLESPSWEHSQNMFLR